MSEHLQMALKCITFNDKIERVGFGGRDVCRTHTRTTQINKL